MNLGGMLGDYELLDRIGAGGMGIVYRARHTLLDRIDAIKVLRQNAGDNAEFRERFLREVRAAARVSHPNIVRVHGASEVAGQLFLAMEYVPAPDLASILADEGALDPARAVGIIAQVAAALDAAHVEQLVHRDVKPANVLVAARATEHAYLTDFGVSRFLAEDSGLTGTGAVGTPAYFAPERFSANLPQNHLSDQYSLACMAFECLTGAKPFPFDDVWTVVSAHMNEPPPVATSVRHGLPAAVDSVLARGMAKNPQDRYLSCAAFAVALRDAVGAEGVTQVLAEPTSVVRPVRSETPVQPIQQPTRKRWPLLAGAAGVVAALGVALALVYGPLGKTPAPTGVAQNLDGAGGATATTAPSTPGLAVPGSAAATQPTAPTLGAPAQQPSQAAPAAGTGAPVPTSAGRANAPAPQSPGSQPTTTTTTVEAQPKAAVSKGRPTRNQYCDAEGCGRIHLTLSGFPPDITCTAHTTSGGKDATSTSDDSTFGHDPVTVGQDGTFDADLVTVYNWPASQIWVTFEGPGCPSIKSPRYTWPG